MSGALNSKLGSTVTIVSGIPPGDSGTGRFVAHLAQRMAEFTDNRIELITRPERPALWQIMHWIRIRAYLRVVREVSRYFFSLWKFWAYVIVILLRRGRHLVLLHPQNLGYRLSLRLLESRKEPALLYLLDSSFFCVMSYNHLPGENGACLQCLDHGFGQRVKNGCKPFPRPDPYAIDFAPRLQDLVKAGKVRVAAQNRRQSELAQKHFGIAVRPPVIGLWTQDWDAIFSNAIKPARAYRNPAAYTWDILFHGHGVEAKGATWLVSVAVLCPKLRFMFPFTKPAWLDAPENCFFVPCSWENGLREAVEKSRYVAVPSLWSAPIEGALVKSIAYARATIVVDNPTSYCDELPDGIVFKLSNIVDAAAAELKHAIESDWLPDSDRKAAWLADFGKTRSSFVSELLALSVSG